MVKIKTIDQFGVTISANDLAEIIWQGKSLMKDEAERLDICEERKKFLEYRIKQVEAVHDALLENGVTTE